MNTEQRTQLTGPELLDDAPVAGGGVILGTLVSVEPGVGLCVVYPGPGGWDPIPARSTVSVSTGQVGQQVVLAFERGDSHRPIVLGVLQTQPIQGEDARSEGGIAQLSKGVDRRVQVDGQRVRIEAERELILQCGQSSILLRASGEVVVKGLKITSRARQTNKIKGGNVLIN